MAHTLSLLSLIRLLQQARRENRLAAGLPLPRPRTELTLTPVGATGVTRRGFVQSAALLGASLAGLTVSRPAMAAQPKIAVVGGGIAGLNAAYQLRKAGITATVYEARAHLGGRIQSVNQGIAPGLVLDLGASFINTDHLDLLGLVKEFGLPLFDRVKNAEAIPSPAVAYYFDGELRPEAEVAENLRPLAEQIERDAALLDQDFDRFAPLFDRLSVRAYLDRNSDKIPVPFVRELIENTIRTEYGVEPDQSSALQLLFNLPTVEGEAVEVLGNSDEVFVIEGGTARLIDALAGVLAGQIRTRMQLVRLESSGKGYRLHFADGQTVAADYVILALPPTVLRKIALQVALPEKFRRYLAEVDLGHNEKLFGGFASKVWWQENGFSLELWSALGFSEAWDGTQSQTARSDGALTFYLGGDEVERAFALSPQSLGAQFVASLDTAIPGAAQAATGRFLRTAWSRDPLVGGGYTSFKPGQITEFGEFFYIDALIPANRQNVSFGNLAFAGEHLSDAFYGFMNGAAQTGRLAARVLCERIEAAALSGAGR